MVWFRLAVLDGFLGLGLLLVVRVALHVVFMKFKRKESFQFFAEPTVPHLP